MTENMRMNDSNANYLIDVPHELQNAIIQFINADNIKNANSNLNRFITIQNFNFFVQLFIHSQDNKIKFIAADSLIHLYSHNFLSISTEVTKDLYLKILMFLVNNLKK